MSTYIVRLPSLKDEHHLTDGRLGVIGVLFGLAALTSMQFVGPLVTRVGSRPVLRASLVVLPRSRPSRPVRPAGGWSVTA